MVLIQLHALSGGCGLWRGWAVLHCTKKWFCFEPILIYINAVDTLLGTYGSTAASSRCGATRAFRIVWSCDEVEWVWNSLCFNLFQPLSKVFDSSADKCFTLFTSSLQTLCQSPGAGKKQPPAAAMGPETGTLSVCIENRSRTEWRRHRGKVRWKIEHRQ